MGRILRPNLPPFIAYDWNNLEQNEQNVAGIFLIKPDGSDPHALVLDVNAIEPSWSPRGTRILYSTGDLTRGCIIWVINPDGSDQRPVISVGLPCLLAQPRWSPTGKKILYIDQNAKTQAIRIADADGSHIHRVPNTTGAEDASFSPDGRYIVFSDWGRPFNHSHERALKPHIFVIRPNGTGLRQIATGGDAEDPSWSPDGKRIIYSCSFYRNPPTGHVTQAGPGPPHAICEVSRTDPTPLTLYSVPAGSYIEGQIWSADGKAILVSDAASQIALLSPAGGTPVEITHSGYSSDPSW
jgi:dipeptidyl aminopeptidase/acylaminoacyl peptidase